jgi:hypothetical protein
VGEVQVVLLAHPEGYRQGRAHVFTPTNTVSKHRHHDTAGSRGGNARGRGFTLRDDTPAPLFHRTQESIQ